ncbi:hypothetical protein ACIP5Y_11575 [Nocardia sp. NPDC088792]|uniref:hypothetical protein n=1 Tax=Nocardia sp. NPDC088792 TaxID=3364332 RepID=UPI0038074981
MSTHDSFGLNQILNELRRPGRTELSAVIRNVTGAVYPELARALPDEAFFEPRLYCQLSNPAVFDMMPAAQLTLGHAAGERLSVTVRTDGAGAAVVPGVGMIRSAQPDRDIAVDYAPEVPDAGLVCDEGEFMPALFAGDTPIEVVQHIDPVVGGFLSEHVEQLDKLQLVRAADFTADLGRAVELIAAADESYHRALCESVRSILVFTHPDAESFAALGIHGMIFVNAQHGSSVDLFVEHLVHQGGHVIFSEATLDRAAFFLVDPDAELPELGERSAYNFFHGLFTEHMECRILVDILSGGGAGEAETPIFRAHLEHVAERHARDLHVAHERRASVFSTAGTRLVEGFESYLRARIDLELDAARGRPVLGGCP